MLERTAAAGLASASMAGRRATGGEGLPGYRAASSATSREGGDGGTALLRGAGGPDFPSAALRPGGHDTDEAFSSTAFDLARGGFQDYTGNARWSPSPSSQEEAGRGNDAEYRRHQHQHQHQPAAWGPPGSGGRRVDDTRAMANGEAGPTTATAAELAFCGARSSSNNTHRIASSSRASVSASPAVSAAVATVSASMISRGPALATAGSIFETSAAAGESVRLGAGAVAGGRGQDRHPIFQQQRGKQPITAADFHSRAPAILPSLLPEPFSSYATPVASTTIGAGFVDGGHGSLSELSPPSALSAYPRGRSNLAWPYEAAHSGAGSVSRGHFGFGSLPSTAENTALRAIGSMALPEGANIGRGLDSSDGSLGFGVVGHTGGGGDGGV